MEDKQKLLELARNNLGPAINELNRALRGENLKLLEPVLARVGRGGHLPHWYEQLLTNRTLPNLDGKTVGSVLEMLFVAVLEKIIFGELKVPPLRINPARGVDLPDLELGIKTPSENYCTSEPFFSAYERLIGSEYDVLAMLTDYQTAKHVQPLKLQVIKFRYLPKTELADYNLCVIARDLREWLLELESSGSWCMKLFRFLAYINQSDWRASRILDLVKVMRNEKAILKTLKDIKDDFIAKNARKARKGEDLIPDYELECITGISAIKPIHLGVIDAADNWITETLREAARIPNNNEWERILTSPLNGQIGMSFALQWRYNFGRIFRNDVNGVQQCLIEECE